MARMFPMVSMEMDDEEKLDFSSSVPMPDKPDYPFGLRICLTEHELEKLELDPTDAVLGGIVHGHFLARITSCSMTDSSDGGKCCRIELQIEDLAIESEDDENKKA